jgi:hypothetical protein
VAGPLPAIPPGVYHLGRHEGGLPMLSNILIILFDRFVEVSPGNILETFFDLPFQALLAILGALGL